MRAALDQRGDNPNIAGKRRRDFQPDEVLWVIEPPPSRVISDRQPLLANQCDQGIARAHSLLNNLDEVEAGLNRVDVHKDIVPPKMLAEPIIEPSSPSPTIVPPVADEDPCHSRLLPLGQGARDTHSSRQGQPAHCGYPYCSPLVKSGPAPASQERTCQVGCDSSRHMHSGAIKGQRAPVARLHQRGSGHAYQAFRISRCGWQWSRGRREPTRWRFRP